MLGHHPAAEIAEAVDEAIFQRLIRGICIEQDVKTILDAVSWFESQGADSVILGCTDMTLLAEQFSCPRCRCWTAPCSTPARRTTWRPPATWTATACGIRRAHSLPAPPSIPAG